MVSIQPGAHQHVHRLKALLRLLTVLWTFSTFSTHSVLVLVFRWDVLTHFCSMCTEHLIWAQDVPVKQEVIETSSPRQSHWTSISCSHICPSGSSRSMRFFIRKWLHDASTAGEYEIWPQQVLRRNEITNDECKSLGSHLCHVTCVYSCSDSTVTERVFDSQVTPSVCAESEQQQWGVRSANTGPLCVYT